jgi:DNA-binding Lrp family transcriptional regulator
MSLSEKQKTKLEELFDVSPRMTSAEIAEVVKTSANTVNTRRRKWEEERALSAARALHSAPKKNGAVIESHNGIIAAPAWPLLEPREVPTPNPSASDEFAHVTSLLSVTADMVNGSGHSDISPDMRKRLAGHLRVIGSELRIIEMRVRFMKGEREELYNQLRSVR